MFEILVYFLVLFVGICIGFVIRSLLLRKTKYDGLIITTKEEGKTIYSLELFEDPENIEFKEGVNFKVTTLDEHLNRK